MSEGTTTIQISIENYKRLNGMKNPGDSFDDVLGRVLDEREAFQERLQRDKQESGSESESETVDRQKKASSGFSVKEETIGEEEADPAPSIESENSRQMALSSTNRLEDDVEQAILELDLSTSASRKKWIPAVRGAYRYLKENGQASKQDFIDDVFPDAPAGYENEQTWWRKVIRPGLSGLPGVRKPNAGGQWEFAGEQE